MDNVELYTPYIDDNTVKKLTQFSTTANFSRGYFGGTSKYLSFGDDYGVLFSDVFTNMRISPEEFKKTMATVWQLFQSGKKVAPIVGFMRGIEGKGLINEHSGEIGNRDYVFVSRAPGITLSNMGGFSSMTSKVNQRLASPEYFYDDIVDTFMTILYQSNLKPDFSALNTLFHPTSGFNFCDFNKSLKAKSHQFYEKHLTNFLKSFVITNDNKPSSQERVSFNSEEEKFLYYSTVAKEIGIIVNKLYGKGVKEEALSNSVNKIDGIPNLERL